MKNKEYYVIDTNNRICGPFDFNELDYLNLYIDSQISIDSTDNFVELQSLTELSLIKHSQSSIFSFCKDYGNIKVPHSNDTDSKKTNWSGKKIYLIALICLIIVVSIGFIEEKLTKVNDKNSSIKELNQEVYPNTDKEKNDLISESSVINDFDVERASTSSFPKAINDKEFTAKIDFQENKADLAKQWKYINEREIELIEHGTRETAERTQLSRKKIYLNTKPLGFDVLILYDSFFDKSWISYTDEFGNRQKIKISNENFNLLFSRYVWSFKIKKDIYDIL
jgi:hypothetical protein